MSTRLNIDSGICVSPVVDPPPREMVQIVRRQLRHIRPPSSVLVVAQDWPCWLPTALAFNFRISGAFFPPKFRKFFPSLSTPLRGDWTDASCPGSEDILLASGSPSFWRDLCGRWPHLRSRFIFVVSSGFTSVPSMHQEHAYGGTARFGSGWWGPDGAPGSR